MASPVNVPPSLTLPVEKALFDFITTWVDTYNNRIGNWQKLCIYLREVSKGVYIALFDFFFNFNFVLEAIEKIF